MRGRARERRRRHGWGGQRVHRFSPATWWSVAGSGTYHAATARRQSGATWRRQPTVAGFPCLLAAVGRQQQLLLDYTARGLGGDLAAGGGRVPPLLLWRQQRQQRQRRVFFCGLCCLSHSAAVRHAQSVPATSSAKCGAGGVRAGSPALLGVRPTAGNAGAEKQPAFPHHSSAVSFCASHRASHKLATGPSVASRREVRSARRRLVSRQKP